MAFHTHPENHSLLHSCSVTTLVWLDTLVARSLPTGVLVSTTFPLSSVLNTTSRVPFLKGRLDPITLLHRNFRDFLSHPIQSPYKACEVSHVFTSSPYFLSKHSVAATLPQTCSCLRLCLIPLFRNLKKAVWFLCAQMSPSGHLTRQPWLLPQQTSALRSTLTTSNIKFSWLVCVFVIVCLPLWTVRGRDPFYHFSLINPKHPKQCLTQERAVHVWNE